MASYQYTPPQGMAPQQPQPAYAQHSSMPNPHDMQQPQHVQQQPAYVQQQPSFGHQQPGYEQHNEKAVYTQPTAQAPMQSGVNPLNVHQKVRLRTWDRTDASADEQGRSCASQIRCNC